ncbi:hypothetical protein BFW01_g1223 [Lasiodiplodia theobromae]|uniref:Bacteriophage T5 Orf172 DNA-binding domain-containing protein n=1 Tax=Lasiodiplodia theobromae TaxID=45133 RepID=A0A8H7IS09_9PEZI|nr:hypothetical protein BFW01_g1223 [Lasiodiplodia theobromae]
MSRNPHWQDIHPPDQRATYVTKVRNCGSWDTLLNATGVRQLESKIIKEMRTDLTPQDEPSRFIYIMESKKHLPGLLKIGVAKRPMRRLAHIKARCGLDDLKIIHSVVVKSSPLRVEKLIHITLSSFSDPMPCKHGARTEHHREWFWCNMGVAKKVVEFWVQWIANAPYKKPKLTDYWFGRVERIRGIPGVHNYETFDDVLTRFKSAMEAAPIFSSQADWDAARRKAQSRLAATASGSHGSLNRYPSSSAGALQLTGMPLPLAPPPPSHWSDGALEFTPLSPSALQFTQLPPRAR